MFRKLLITLLLFSFKSYFPQVTATLDTLTKLENDEVHLETLSSRPNEEIKEPPAPNGEVNIAKKYLNLFYSRDTEADNNISILIYQLDNGDILYIDKNNDNDLSNDGGPLLFPLAQNSVSFGIVSQSDSAQILKLALFRKPDVPDSMLHYYVNSNGDLCDDYLKIMRILKGDFDLNGNKRSFFFDDRITLRKGQASLTNESYSIGLFDYSNNGSYNDGEDLFIIDIDKTGKLDVPCKPKYVYALNDIFNAHGKNYKIREADKYGKFVILEETIEEPTHKYIDKYQALSDQSEKNDTLQDGFWDTKFATLNGDTTTLREYKGKYLFINVWGEWCGFCLQEMDELKYIYEKHKDKMILLGILYAKDVDRAKDILKNKNITWKNILINDDLRETANQTGIPLNILIYPDGITFKKKNSINRNTFDILFQELSEK
jgi:thiol-disulfide isomerase/thioredoxin